MKTEINIEIMIAKIEQLIQGAETAKEYADRDQQENAMWVARGRMQAYDVLVTWLHNYAMGEKK